MSGIINGIKAASKAAASRAGNDRVVNRTRPTSPVRAASRVDKGVSAKVARTSSHSGSCS